MILLKLIDTTNVALFKKYQGFSAPVVFMGGCLWVMDLERLKNGDECSGFHTSAIVGCSKIQENIVIFQTLNNEYTFQILEGELDLEGGVVGAMIEENRAKYKGRGK